MLFNREIMKTTKVSFAAILITGSLLLAGCSSGYSASTNYTPRKTSEGAAATAVCRDGTYSYSQHRQGTCSHHGGVDNWLK